MPVCADPAAVLEQHPLKAGVKCVDVYNNAGPVVQVYSCNNGNNQKFNFNSTDGTLSDSDSPNHCIAVSSVPPSGGAGGFQLWSKKQPGNALAVLVFNGQNEGDAVAVDVDLGELGLSTTATYKLRDVWARKDTGTVASTFKTAPIGVHDSVLLMLTPQ